MNKNQKEIEEQLADIRADREESEKMERELLDWRANQMAMEIATKWNEVGSWEY